MGPWALGVPLVLVSALGLLLNAYVLLVVFGLGKQTQQQQKANTLLLIHLGAVEAAVCLVLLIFATGSWSAAGTWCVLHGFLLALLHPVALWTVTGLNCDRYCAIAAPLHYTALVSPRRVTLCLAVSWAGALLLCLPPFSGLVPPYRYFPGLGCCAPDFGGSVGAAVPAGVWGSLYGAAYALLGLGLPALLVTACNLRVLGIARYHRHRIASAIYEVTLSAQVTITHQRNPFFVPAVTAPAAGGPPRFHSAASTVMQLVGSLYLLYFPYCGLILWEACAGGVSGGGTAAPGGSPLQQPTARLQAHPRLASLASLLLACSPPINCLLYGLKSRTLRRSVQNYWRKKATKSELQQEIQARTPSAAGSRRPSISGPAASFFQFPPLQRRLSEALLALNNCRPSGATSFGSGTIAGVFHRARLQPAASCNTLRVPNTELGESGRLVRSSASAVSLMAAHYRSDFLAGGGAEAPTSAGVSATPKRSPRILITRACSEESQDGGGSPLLLRRHFATPVSLPPCEKRRWRHRSFESDSSTGSSEAVVWTTGVQAQPAAPRPGGGGGGGGGPCIPRGPDAPGARRFTRVKTLEEGAAVFSSAGGASLARGLGCAGNISASSDAVQLDGRHASGLADRPPTSSAAADGEAESGPSEAEDDDAEEGSPGSVRAPAGGSPRSSSGDWSYVEEAAQNSPAEDNSRASTDDDGLVMRTVGEASEDEEERGPPDHREGGAPRPTHGEPAGAREAEASATADQLRPLLTSSS